MVPPPPEYKASTAPRYSAKSVAGIAPFNRWCFRSFAADDDEDDDDDDTDDGGSDEVTDDDNTDDDAATGI